MNEIEKLEDFTLLLLVHMGFVDGSLHPNEKDTILERMKELFPSYSQLNDKFTETESVYRKFGPMKTEELLMSALPKFSQVDAVKKKEIYTALFDVINANGRVNEEETQTLQLFKAWLTT